MTMLMEDGRRGGLCYCNVHANDVVYVKRIEEGSFVWDGGDVWRKAVCVFDRERGGGGGDRETRFRKTIDSRWDMEKGGREREKGAS